MLKTNLLENKKTGFLFVIILAAFTSYCFKTGRIDTDWLSWGNNCLSQSYDASADVKLKKWELILTDDSFLRLRKTYQNGKQEYFSFQLQKLDDLSYLGDVSSGTLQLKAKSDDIIVQTYNDRKGDIDSMATVLNIPVKNMGPERLDSLRTAFNYFKEKIIDR
jgi:hypothetical protein